MEENQEITNEFRYFSLYLFFGNSENRIPIFYSNIFLNVCRISTISIINNNVNQKKCLQKLNSSKESAEWIFIIPCFEFPILINGLIKATHVNSFLIHCHGKHAHDENYFKTYNKYKGIFHNHKELINLLKNINKQYKGPEFNYELENKDKHKKYNFSLNSNIQSKIKTSLRDLYERACYVFNELIGNYNISNQLLFKTYLYYKDAFEGKKEIEDNEQIKFFINFLNIENDLSLEQKYNLCKEFIPKLYLVVYYYLSFYYSNPFKMQIEDVKKNIIKAKENNDKNKLYSSIGEIINECYKKIINNESILNEKIINHFHELLIQIIIIEEGNYDIYQYLEALSDFVRVNLLVSGL